VHLDFKIRRRVRPLHTFDVKQLQHFAPNEPRSLTRDNMALVSRGYQYQSVHVSGDRVHLGDVYHYEPPPEERAFNAVLESLKYPGMHDRRDALNEAHEGTFDWTFLEGETRFVKERDENGNAESDHFRFVDMNFKTWLQDTEQNLFRVVGKPGSGKSTFM
jgi:hypothetical protein